MESGRYRSETQEVILIAAVAEKSRVIGNGLDLPWHIPEDLKRFKRLTLGQPLIIGRTTYDAIIHQFGRPLADRRIVVLTRGGSDALPDDVETYASIDEAMDALSECPLIYVAGGSSVYEQFLPRATALELTLVEGDHAGDAHFPEYEHLIGDTFEKTFEARHPGFRFVTYERIDEF